MDDHILYGAVGCWAGRDELFSYQVDEQRWQNLLYAFFGGGLLFDTKSEIVVLEKPVDGVSHLRYSML